MGWTYVHKPEGTSVKEFFTEEFGYRYENGNYGRVLDCAVVNLRTAYIAYEIGGPEQETKVIGIVCLLDYCKDYHNFGYKDMDEEMGPYCYDCPERILKLLTPTDDENALKWRQICWEKIKKRKSMPRLSKNMRIRIAKPLKFSNGRKRQELIVKNPRHSIFVDDYGLSYRIPRQLLNSIGYEIINN